MTRRFERADEGLLPENYERLNSDFYEGKPWLYFDRRLMHVARLAANAEAYHDALETPIRLGPMVMAEVPRSHSDDEPPGLDDQSFVAAEAQVLLHHTAETLLRLMHAHAPDTEGVFPPCAWLGMSRVRPWELNAWIKTRIRDSSPEDRGRLAAKAFGEVLTSEELTEAAAQHLGLCAEHFLDADSYNAAKHGFAVQGARRRLTVELPDLVLIDTQGLTIDWLAVRRGQWVCTSRWFSVEATIAVSFMATRLIQALWIAARKRYLGTPVTLEFALAPPHDLFAAFGVPHPTLAEVEEPLAYDGVEHTLRVRKSVSRSNIRRPTR